MEKKGDVLTQLATISDLFEKVNANIKSHTVIFELSKMEFDNVFEKIRSKSNTLTNQPKDSFNIRIGVVDFIFNTSNV